MPTNNDKNNNNTTNRHLPPVPPGALSLRMPLPPSSQPSHTAIDFDDSQSMSSSSTDVYELDNHSLPSPGPRQQQTENRNPVSLFNRIFGIRRNALEFSSNSSQKTRAQEKSDALELETYNTNDPCQPVINNNETSINVNNLAGNGRRKLSMAFLQDMLPMGTGDDTPMGTFMGSHLERALRLTHAKSSKLTLKFLNVDVENDYQSYFWSTMSKRWSMFIAIGGSIAIAVQVAGLLGTNGDGLSGATVSDWGILVGTAILPIAIVFLLPSILKEATMARWVHWISLAYLLVTGPVMTTIRYTNSHIRTDNTFNPSVTAPIYIVALVAAPTWFAVFSYATKAASEKDAYILNSIVLFFACFVALFIAFDIERNLRHQYLSNSRFLSITRNLQSQLDGLERSLLAAAASRNGFSTADLSSPLERAMLAIRGLIADASIAEEHVGVLELVMACLSSPNLLTPDLDVQVKEGNVSIDDEQEKWLFNEVATRRASRTSEAGLEQLAQFETNDVENSVALEVTAVGGRRTSTSSTYTPTAIISVERLDSIIRSDETRRLLFRVPEFNFPIFDFTKSTNGHPLLVLGNHLIQDSGLLKNLNLDAGKFLNFLATIESGYHSNLAFHNSIHAADVLHCINYLIQLPTIRSIFTDLELLAVYLAAVVHDFDHPGFSNQFLITTSDRRALLYNDKSVLENHHCASAFEVLARKDCSFLSTLDRADYKSLRENVVDMVLATDLAQHFSLLTMFKKKVLTGDTFDPLGTREDRTLLMQMLMKCSDVSNPTKIGPEYDEWINRLHEEWYVQGDMEKALGLPYSAFCNRDGPHASNPASSQTGFINFIVSPLYEAFSAWTPIDEVWEGLEFNKKRWADAAATTVETQQPLKRQKSKADKSKSPIMKNFGSVPSSFGNGSNGQQQQHMKLTRSKSTTHASLQMDSLNSESITFPAPAARTRRDSK
ncbi:hypothetical protein HK100_001822 [Physocladia obscura]|uniref:Phosphodiesterase n=1 Tax=Physocladia obscura TaxID=109957 RepID=A0AAD5SYC7_9FUNG|nr:hypothetical protein HK100_001822 [Physocladia obscura]